MPHPPPGNFHTQQPPPIGAPPPLHLPPPPIAQQRHPAVPPSSIPQYPHPGLPPPAPSTATVSTTPAATFQAFSASTSANTPAPALAPVATRAIPTQQQIDEAWAEYTAPNGAKYYHNPLLKESTYIKPDALKKKETSTTVTSASTKRPWAEYTDPSTGKKYYSDGVTTTWEKPPEMDTAEDAAVASTDSSGDPPKPKKKKKSVVHESYANKDEAIAGFKGFLLAKGIQPSSKWNEVSKYLSSDSRWEAFSDMLSVGERRQALAEYQTKRANELKQQERQERIRAKEAFGQLLTDVLQTVSGFSAYHSRFSDVRATLAKDDRFHAVSEEETRENLFLEFCEELRKREERKKRNKKREAQEAFNAFLTEQQEAGKLTFASTWELFVGSLSSEERNDTRFLVTSHMTEADRQLYFADFVIELQAAEDDKRRRIRDARRRAEKAQRDAYRDLLRRLATEGRIRPYTKWRSIEDIVNLEDSYKAVVSQDPDTPREIFEEWVDAWDSTYHRERAVLTRLVNPPGRASISVRADTSLEDFTEQLLGAAEQAGGLDGDAKHIVDKSEPVSAARLYWEELITRAKHLSQRPGSLEEDSSEDEGEIKEEDVATDAPEFDGGGTTTGDNAPEESLGDGV